MPFLEEK